jgi:hypothetical protein
MLERVPAGEWPRINREVCAEVGKFSDGGTIRFGATVVLASGTK